MAEKLGLTDLQFGERLGTPLGKLRTAPAVISLDVVDSHFPAVSHWSFERLQVEIADPSSDVPLPLLGLDLLNHFETCLHPQEGYILLRKVPSPS